MSRIKTLLGGNMSINLRFSIKKEKSLISSFKSSKDSRDFKNALRFQNTFLQPFLRHS